MKTLLNAILFSACFSAGESTFAQDRKVIRGFTFQTENDVFAGILGFKNEDKDYSGSFRFEFYTDYLRQGIFPLFRNRCEDPLEDRPLNKNFNSIYIQGMGFTPNRDAFGLTTVDSTQRPYSSLFGIGWKRIASFDEAPLLALLGIKRRSAIVSDIFIGGIGTDIPGDFQNFLHRYISNSDIVRGWENQIGNGGRWAFNYRVSSHIKVFRNDAKHSLFLSPHVSVGNLFINGGLKLSVSNQSPATMGLISAMPSNELTEKEQVEKSCSWLPRFLSHWLYEVYFKPTVVGRNTLLEGLPYYDNSTYVLQKSSLEGTVYDAGAKLVFMYDPDGHGSRRTFAFFEVVYRSKEFDFGPQHVFGNIGFTIWTR